MADFYQKVGDRYPKIQIACKNSAGEPADFSDIIGGEFHMNSAAGANVTTGAVTIIDTDLAVVEYAWTALDAALPAGDYLAEVEMEHTDGSTETFPNTTNITITRVAQLA